MATQAQPQSKTVSLEDYFEMEFIAETRHEFWNGEIRAMAYTSSKSQIKFIT
jgi:hypothetical protein